MRRYTDSEGRAWDVVVGRESFGALYAIFAPAPGNHHPPRQTPLAGDSSGEAGRELDALSDDEMADLFERSEPKRLA